MLDTGRGCLIRDPTVTLFKWTASRRGYLQYHRSSLLKPHDLAPTIAAPSREDPPEQPSTADDS